MGKVDKNSGVHDLKSMIITVSITKLLEYLW